VNVQKLDGVWEVSASCSSPEDPRRIINYIACDRNLALHMCMICTCLRFRIVSGLYDVPLDGPNRTLLFGEQRRKINRPRPLVCCSARSFLVPPSIYI
jgi:hypothetical protein